MKKQNNIHLQVIIFSVIVTVFAFTTIKILSTNKSVFIQQENLNAQSVPCNSEILSSFGARTFTGTSYSTEIACATAGNDIYLQDSRYKFLQAPSSLQGKAIGYIKTPNLPMKDNTNLNWSVTMTRPATVYVFYRKITGVDTPNWITQNYTKLSPATINFSDTSGFLTRSNESSEKGLYDVYRYNNFAVGTAITFREAKPANGDLAYSMYIVGATSTGNNPTDPPNNPTNPPNNPTNPPNNPTNPPNNPTNPPNRTNPPASTPNPTSLPPVSGDFPCGKFPNANPGCMNVSYQSWFDNVPATDETMNVNYTPRLTHHHYDCAIPAARANGQYLRQGMKTVCAFIRYNSIIPYQSSNKGWYRSQSVGNTYEQFTLNLAPCQTSKYQGKECKSENVHTVTDSLMKSSTEIRNTPNAEFVGMGGQRHFLSTNWQTAIGYRSSSEFTSRYWIGECGDYLRTILKNVDRHHKGNEAIPTVSGTIRIPFETNGGCGSLHKTFVFLDPSQHVTNAGAQTGTTLMEQNGFFNGELSWNTSQTSNGLHSILFINMEGKAGSGGYVSASGVSLKYNVQN